MMNGIVQAGPRRIEVVGRDQSVHVVARQVTEYLQDHGLTPHDALTFYCRAACGLDTPPHFMPIYRTMREYGCQFDLVTQ